MSRELNSVDIDIALYNYDSLNKLKLCKKKINIKLRILYFKFILEYIFLISTNILSHGYYIYSGSQHTNKEKKFPPQQLSLYPNIFLNITILLLFNFNIFYASKKKI
jgi:hypothetical protein